jgi:MFS transporter, PPP family, 3-phenylpropionic acid transporter
LRIAWPFSFNVFLFGGYAFVLPFLVLYYQSNGFTGAQIGLLTGITPLITMLGASLWTAFADATHKHRRVMSTVILVGALSLFVFPLLDTFMPVFLIAVLFYAFYAPVPSLADSATMYMLADRKEMYGRVRMGGTIGFGVAAFLAGVLVQNYGLRLAFWGGGSLMLLALLTSQKLTHNPQTVQESTREGLHTMLANRRWMLFLMLAFSGGVAMAGTNTYLFPFLKELGANETTMGLAMTIGTISEVPVLFYGHYLVRRFKPFRLLMLAMVFTGLRLLAFAAAGTPALVLVVQLFNGLAFPIMWMAGVSYANENAPSGLSATAQGMFSAMVFGFGTAVGGFAGGPLMENIGGRGTYNVFGLSVLAIVILVAFLQRFLPEEAVAISVSSD